MSSSSASSSSTTTVLRVKRRRDEAPADVLVLDLLQEARPTKRASVAALVQQMGSASLADSAPSTSISASTTGAEATSTNTPATAQETRTTRVFKLVGTLQSATTADGHDELPSIQSRIHELSSRSSATPARDRLAKARADALRTINPESIHRQHVDHSFARSSHDRQARFSQLRRAREASPSQSTTASAPSSSAFFFIDVTITKLKSATDAAAAPAPPPAAVLSEEEAAKICVQCPPIKRKFKPRIPPHARRVDAAASTSAAAPSAATASSPSVSVDLHRSATYERASERVSVVKDVSRSNALQSLMNDYMGLQGGASSSSTAPPAVPSTAATLSTTSPTVYAPIPVAHGIQPVDSFAPPSSTRPPSSFASSSSSIAGATSDKCISNVDILDNDDDEFVYDVYHLAPADEAYDPAQSAMINIDGSFAGWSELVYEHELEAESEDEEDENREDHEANEYPEEEDDEGEEEGDDDQQGEEEDDDDDGDEDAATWRRMCRQAERAQARLPMCSSSAVRVVPHEYGIEYGDDDEEDEEDEDDEDGGQDEETMRDIDDSDGDGSSDDSNDDDDELISSDGTIGTRSLTISQRAWRRQYRLQQRYAQQDEALRQR